MISSSIQEGDTVSGGSVSYVVQFNEPMLTANLDSTDFSLQGTYFGASYTPASFSWDPTGTTLTIQYNSLPDDRYTLTLLSADGRFEDAIGNNLDGEPLAWPMPPHTSGDGVEGGNFVVHFYTDIGTVSFPTPLAGVNPSGGLIYSGSSVRNIASGTDTQT